MRNARKTDFILDLEKEVPMSEATTLREANPRINQIAVLYDLKTSNTRHFKFIRKYMTLEKLLNELS